MSKYRVVRSYETHDHCVRLVDDATFDSVANTELVGRYNTYEAAHTIALSLAILLDINYFDWVRDQDRIKK